MPEPVIDLRSDTVTMPSPAMLDAMVGAELGDDVLGDDPTVHRLEEQVAGILGKASACFVPSGTMANQLALRAQTEPGDEIITHETGHTIHYETGAPAALSGLMIRTLGGPAGQFEADDVLAAIRPVESHFARTRLVIVENTSNGGGGSVWPIERIRQVTAAARERGLATHLDGARIWNACAASGLAPSDYAQHFDTVACCFSKGLGAPVGSAVAGTKETIDRARRFRKMFGGAMRQAGLLAAAALYALENNRERLAEDHANARILAERLASTPGLEVDLQSVQSNMVIFSVDPGVATPGLLCERAESRGVRMFPVGPTQIRAVLHMGVSREMTERAGQIIADSVDALRSG